MIRICVGMFIMMGAAGTSDVDYTVPFWEIAAWAFTGLAIFAWGTIATIQKQS